MIHLCFVTQDSPLHRLVATNRKLVTKMPHLYAPWPSGDSWNSYYRAVLKSEKGDSERRRRRLEECGRITSETVEGNNCAPVIAWTLAHQKPRDTQIYYDWLTLAATA